MSSLFHHCSRQMYYYTLAHLQICDLFYGDRPLGSIFGMLEESGKKPLIIPLHMLMPTDPLPYCPFSVFPWPHEFSSAK